MSSTRPVSSSGRGQKTLSPGAPLNKANSRTTEALRSLKPEKGARHSVPAQKRGRGRPPKVQTLPAPAATLAIAPPPVPSSSSPTPRIVQEEPKKKIANCISPLGRQTRQPPPRGRRGGRPVLVRPPRDESESEDDIPPCFSDVVKIIQKKVKETQNEISRIDESFNNYKKAHEADTNFAMKFYAAIPMLHERVEAGAAFDDDLMESVFSELFPANTDSKKSKHKSPAEEAKTKAVDKNSASKKCNHSTTEDTSSDREEPTGTARLRRSSLKK
ncbi:hypothetical protein BV898_05292 [Hypsibius exemplaris]|uniref:Uncharacterized protein n=1 Tax=Hypsibius exemplaris TaxID=2072580 RepID=A0A1W0WZS5_HYPEX|nr:hypothetical protein BV898_05292 [Hypsibius exemplaris]